MAEGKLEKIDKVFDSIKGIIGGVLVIVITVVIAVVIIKAINSGEKESDDRMSVYEAQDKCVIINWIGFQKANYENKDIEEANEYCLAMWNSPNREDSFIEYVAKEWEIYKDEVYNGKSYTDYYNEYRDQN